MQANIFLKTFWRMEVKPQVFVAMSFAEVYRNRFERIIAPAISSITPLVPYRVDLSKSGDSIQTDIMDGIAHSRMILADVSSMGKDSKTDEPYRNSNVMYEVGLALACRQSSDVLLLRDDRDKFLFDVSTVPHLQVNFSEAEVAKNLIHDELVARLQEQSFVNDARVQLALNGLSDQEIKILLEFLKMPAAQAKGWEVTGTVLSVYEAAIMRLLDKQVIKMVGIFEKGYPAYELTPLGKIVAEITKSGLPKYRTIVQ